MNFSIEKQHQDLRRGIRGSLNFHNDQDIWSTKHACSVFALSFHFRAHPEERFSESMVGKLGLDTQADRLGQEFIDRRPKAPVTNTAERVNGFRDPKLRDTYYIAALDPKYFEHIYCRPEVTMALSVVAIEKDLDHKALLAIVPNIRRDLKDAACVAALQERFPDITDKRIKKAVKEIKQAAKELKP